jgi:hypothetical protein
MAEKVSEAAQKDLDLITESLRMKFLQKGRKGNGGANGGNGNDDSQSGYNEN